MAEGEVLVQVVKRTGRIDRVKPEEAPPVVELMLRPNERVISLELRESYWQRPERKTGDWHWTAYVEVRL